MHVSRREGLVFGRLQQHIGVLVVSQFMRTLTDEEGRPRLLIKGGSALELRRGITQARATRDLDAVTSVDLELVWQTLADSAARGWEGFTAVLTEPEVIDIGTHAAKPAASPSSSSARVPHSSHRLSLAEPGNTETVDWTHSPAFELVGLSGSQPIPCMTIPWQIAQKLHAVTATLPDGGLNDRAHDLVDLQILEAFIIEQPLAAVRHACIEVFEARAQPPWPPTVTVHLHWPRIYAQALSSVDGLGLAPDAQQASALVTDLIARVDDSHP